MIGPQENITRWVRLQPGEQIHAATRPSFAATLPFYLFTLGLYGFWRKRHLYLLTNQRVVARKGIIIKSDRSLPLARIQDANTATVLWLGNITFSTAGGPSGVEHVGPLSPADARLFADLVLQASRAARGDDGLGSQASLSGGPKPSGSIAAELTALADLRDRGVLSEAEFEAQKRRLLDG